jgi:acyl carrier protein
MPAPGDLERRLKLDLPHYMIPSAFVTLDQMPLTPNGKVDRSALPADEATRRPLDLGYAAPRSEMERTISGVWQEVLNIEKISIDSSFFELGGHSLLIIKLRGKLQAALSREIPLVELFRYPTIRSFNGFLNGEDGSQGLASALSKDGDAAQRGARKARRELRIKAQSMEG